MSQLILNRGNKYRKSIFARLLPKRFEIGPYLLMFSLIVFVALITVTTLMFSTRQVTKGYVLNSLEAENQTLIRDNEVIDMQISQVRALSTIEQSDKVQKMVKPREIVFIDGDTAIASN